MYMYSRHCMNQDHCLRYTVTATQKHGTKLPLKLRRLTNKDTLSCPEVVVETYVPLLSCSNESHFLLHILLSLDQLWL